MGYPCKNYRMEANRLDRGILRGCMPGVCPPGGEGARALDAVAFPKSDVRVLEIDAVTNLKSDELPPM
jgi:hypothetical protein